MERRARIEEMENAKQARQKELMDKLQKEDINYEKMVNMIK